MANNTSVELFIYPQFYDETWQPTAQNPTEYVPDGILWSTAFTPQSGNASSTPLEFAVSSNPPANPNEWAGYGSNGLGPFPLGTQPYTAGSGVGTFGVFTGWGGLSGGVAGAYTWMTGLSPGTNYNIDFEQMTISPDLNRELIVKIFDMSGAVVQTITYNPADLTTLVLPTKTFTSTGADHILGFRFRCTASPSLAFKPTIVSVTEQVLTYTVDELLSDGQLMLDLYDFEDIPLTLSIDNFINAAEKVQSYSKAFKLPGTKRNNRILKNEYEITSTLDTTATNSYDFNPLRKTQIYLQQEGYIIFEGFMKLISIDVKDGQLSYNINLYSEVIALKDFLKNKKFNDLDFSELNHLYIKSVIKSSWWASGILLNNPLGLDSFAGAPGAMNTTVLKYPFIDWEHGLWEADGSGDPSANIGYPEGNNLAQAFRPVIQLRYIINNMFRDAGFTYTSTFFDSSDFGKLFMDFNWGTGNTPTLEGGLTYTSHFYQSISGGGTISANSLPYVPSTTVISQFTPMKLFAVSNANTTSVLPPDYDPNTYVYTATSNNQQVQVNSDFRTVNLNFGFGNTKQFTMKWVKNWGLANEQVLTSNQTFVNAGGSSNLTANFTTWLDIGETLTPIGAQTWLFQVGTLQQGSTILTVDNPTCTVDWAISSPPLVSDSLLSTLRGKLGQWEFLEGLFKMFNLITMVNPQNPSNIIIETYDDIFNNLTGTGLDLESRGIKKDWTDKTDAQEFKYKPLSSIKRNTIFQYAEDKDDYCFQNYKEAFQGYLYGSYEIDASDYNILQGTTKIEAKPFASTLIKAYDSAFPWMITPACYSVNDEGLGTSFNNKPRIFYDNGKLTIGPANTFFFPSQNGEFGENYQYLYQMSNFSSLPPTASDNDLHYGTCQILNVNNPTINTLYNRFWASYYDQLYDPDTRVVTLKINLTPSDINQFDFADLVMIKNRAYRVNKIDYKPGDLAKVELILIT